MTNKLTEDEKDLILDSINCAINESFSNEQRNELFALSAKLHAMWFPEAVDGGESSNAK